MPRPSAAAARYTDEMAPAAPSGRPTPLYSHMEGGGAAFPAIVLGVLALIATEVMFFGGLISAFYVLRAGSFAWPPPGQPRLPVAITGLNTLVLFSSGYTMRLGVREARQGRHGPLVYWLAATLILGAAFLTVQGSEWIKLIRFGLTVRSSLYGALFYTIVGAHAVHVMWAVGALLMVTYRARRHYYSATNCDGVVACSLYWYFVVLLWGVIYATVYLG